MRLRKESHTVREQQGRQNSQVDVLRSNSHSSLLVPMQVQVNRSFTVCSKAGEEGPQIPDAHGEDTEDKARKQPLSTCPTHTHTHTHTHA
jgi:hypothetical protein